MLEQISTTLHNFLFSFGSIVVAVLEIIGVLFIVYGSIKSLIQLIKVKFDFRDFHFKILLGESLATALQFKLGAEIIKTVIINDLKELIVVGVVVILRAIITYIIHWEIKEASCDI